jgi:hypothetical protein
MLKAARERAEAAGRDPWEFAVEIDELMATGIDHAWLRWFITQGLVEHARELLNAGAEIRRFAPLTNLSLPEGTCFAITPAGLALAERLVADDLSARLCATTPVWDPERRQLSWAGIIVKRFRARAENQERILNAFQEEGWPGRVDDPLPPTLTADSQSRLRDAIRRLNDCQARRMIRFYGDGTGTGVCWGPAATDRVPSQAGG